MIEPEKDLEGPTWKIFFKTWKTASEGVKCHFLEGVQMES